MNLTYAPPFSRIAKDVVDFIADYMQNIRQYRVFPDVRPGYMRQLLPDQPPTEGESWPHIMNDIKKLILPGMTHWQSPYMHAYFPALNSPASLMGKGVARLDRKFEIYLEILNIDHWPRSSPSQVTCCQMPSIVSDSLGHRARHAPNWR